MKLKTIVNKVTDGAITSVTIQVFEDKVLLEIDFSIEYSIAAVESVRTYNKDLSTCLELIKQELKDRGIFSIKYKEKQFEVDAFTL